VSYESNLERIARAKNTAEKHHRRSGGHEPTR
jgi:hypothetical protein